MIGAEEEQLIVLDSPSDRPSILVLSDDRLLLPGLIEEKVIRIQSFVPEELEGGTVEGILAGFRNDVDVRPGIPPKRSVGLAGLAFGGRAIAGGRSTGWPFVGVG